MSAFNYPERGSLSRSASFDDEVARTLLGATLMPTAAEKCQFDLTIAGWDLVDFIFLETSGAIVHVVRGTHKGHGCKMSVEADTRDGAWLAAAEQATQLEIIAKEQAP